MVRRSTKKGNTSESSSMEVSQSYLGVHTRAKTLALQEKPDYLELRSRRLEKPKMVVLGSSRRRRIPDHDKEDKENTPEEKYPELENGLELDTTTRHTRVAEDVTSHRSPVRQRTPENTVPNENIPSALEIDKFFAQVEQSEQCRFINKYNFDVVNDAPLPGSYEWVKVLP